MGSNDNSRVIYFPDDVLENTPLPERFTFPFYYEPHPLTKVAAEALQQYLEAQTHLDHNFGLTADAGEMPIGKMFGVLLVQDGNGRIGYLSAFSGKLAGTNDHSRFVPPVFDMLTENSFFLKEQEVISSVNTRLEEILSSDGYQQLKSDFVQFSAQSAEELAAFKLELKENKEARRLRREENQHNPDAASAATIEAELSKASHYDRHRLRLLKEEWKARLEETQTKLSQLEAQIEALRNERRDRSAALQNQLFEQYTFLNKDGESKSLYDIFKDTAFGKPPSAAGECATPKLLQFAFAHGFKPLAMAEFWWGASPKSEIRKHKQFYPACTGKCKPILAHMLEGIPLDENPFLAPAREDVQLTIVYEDNHLLLVNKPSGLRSVPGVNIDDSVFTRLKNHFGIPAPYVAHRLDMATSGLLLVAKSSDVYKLLQRQFLKRTISKRYTALLAGRLAETSGEISLPLAADYFNRPVQIVCFDTGKESITRWEAVESTGDTTRVHFWPLTGRTHQLRVHAAHRLGLNAPIVGDDIYGTAANRLHLHAAEITFTHPVTKERLTFEVADEF
ncbi:MAG: RNA pseudouridine synthase [Flavipsychrobacter sp.]|nr:RNA pseudouridine synthase [Flavipsychrobacter sp.]